MAQVNRVCFILFLLLPLKVLASSASDLLQSKLDILNSFQAQFEQNTRNPVGKLLQSSQGRLVIAQGGKFLIDTQKPFPQKLISNGEDFWTYDPDLYQVVISELSRDLNKVPILLFGSGDKTVLDAYTILNFESDNTHNFVLKPKAEDSLFETLTLSFLHDSPSSILIVDTLEQETTLTFLNSELNPKINPSEFEFEIPEGIDVIDER